MNLDEVIAELERRSQVEGYIIPTRVAYNDAAQLLRNNKHQIIDAVLDDAWDAVSGVTYAEAESSPLCACVNSCGDVLPDQDKPDAVCRDENFR